MRIIITAFLLSLTLIVKADYWTQKADFGGGTRQWAAGFSLNGYGYVGAGVDTTGSFAYKKDFWQYDPILNVWTQKADAGNIPRGGCIGFAVGNYGYIGLGQNSNPIPLFDIWQYNPVNNTWTQKSNFPGSARIYSCSFICNNKAYVGLGAYSFSYFNDLWQYEPNGDYWVQKANLPGAARFGAIAFSVNNYGYVGSGKNQNFLSDYWKYNPISNSWSAIPSCPGLINASATGFGIGPVGYACLGLNSQDSSLWMYSPLLNTWIQKASFPSFTRGETVSFVIGSKAYVATGGRQWGGFILPVNEVWEYSSDSTTSVEEVELVDLQFSLYPNPPKNSFKINLMNMKDKNCSIKIYNIVGHIVTHRNLNDFQTEVSFNTTQYHPGVYSVVLFKSETIIESQKLFIIK